MSLSTIKAKRLVAVAALLLSSVELAFPLTLKEALESAYENNAELKIEKVRIAQKYNAEVAASKTGFLPYVAAQFDASNTKRERLNQPAPSTNQNNDSQSRAASSQRILDQLLANQSASGEGQGRQMSLSISQNLIDPGSIAKYAAAKSSFEVDKVSFQLKESEVLAKSIEAYLGVALAMDKCTLAEQRAQYYKQALESTRAKLKIGEATNTDLDMTVAYFEGARAELELAKAGLYSARAAFENTIMLEPKDLSSVSVPDLPKSFEEFEKELMASNLSLKQAVASTKASKAAVKAAKADILPILSARASVYKTGDEDEWNLYAASASLRLDVPIFQRGAEHIKIKEQQYRSKGASIGLKNAIQVLKHNASYQWNALLAYKSTYDSAKLAVLAREKSFAGMKKQFDLGLLDILKLMEEEVRLSKAKNDYLEAENKYLIFAYQVKSSLGHLNPAGLKLKVERFNLNRVPQDAKRILKNY